MCNINKICISILFFVSMISAATAIDIEPEHDNSDYDTNDVVITPKLSVITPNVPAPQSADGPPKVIIAPESQKITVNPLGKPTVTPVIAPTTVTMAPVTDNSVIQQGERIYFARSVTSNNPEYKTRFSILHNTPSPKRIGGERLYNLSDSPFRLAVSGNNIKILDNPVFKLQGINSAKGNYGEIKVLDGSLLNIEGVSNRFRGKWDLDGTGDRNLKITPTNLVSGVIPVHYKTFKADGTVVTDEIHDLTFKAMAMGPYNGYWSDGADIGVFLWGMSKNKLESKEMSYLGLDLGIVTENAPEVTGATAVEPNAILAPIAPIAPIGFAGATNSIAPFGGGFGAAPFIGGFSGGFGGFGGGFIGGGGGSSVINNITNDNSVSNVNNDNSVNNVTNNNNVTNTVNTIVNNGCIVNNGVISQGTDNDIIDSGNNNNSKNKVKCDIVNTGDTVVNNNVNNDGDSSNTDVINENIINTIVNNGCAVNNGIINNGGGDITNSGNNNSSETDLNCKIKNDGDVCINNPLAAGCGNFCDENPYSKSCCALYPDNCKDNPVDPCIKDPTGPTCGDPSTPVNEPFVPLSILVAIISFAYFRKRK